MLLKRYIISQHMESAFRTTHKRALSLLVVALVLCVRPQVSSALPPAMTTVDLERIASDLSLSRPQTHAVLGMFERYLEQSTQVAASISNQPPVAPETVDETIRFLEGTERSRRNYTARLRSLDDVFFSEISAILSEEQQITLLLLIERRQRALLSTDVFLRRTGLVLCDLSNVPRDTVLSQEGFEAARETLRAYETTLTSILTRLDKQASQVYLDEWRELRARGIQDSTGSTDIIAAAWPHIGGQALAIASELDELNESTARRIRALLSAPDLVRFDVWVTAHLFPNCAAIFVTRANALLAMICIMELLGDQRPNIVEAIQEQYVIIDKEALSVLKAAYELSRRHSPFEDQGDAKRELASVMRRALGVVRSTETQIAGLLREANSDNRCIGTLAGTVDDARAANDLVGAHDEGRMHGRRALTEDIARAMAYFEVPADCVELVQSRLIAEKDPAANVVPGKSSDGIGVSEQLEVSRAVEAACPGNVVALRVVEVTVAMRAREEMCERIAVFDGAFNVDVARFALDAECVPERKDVLLEILVGHANAVDSALLECGEVIMSLRSNRGSNDGRSVGMQDLYSAATRVASTNFQTAMAMLECFASEDREPLRSRYYHTSYPSVFADVVAIDRYIARALALSDLSAMQRGVIEELRTTGRPKVDRLNQGLIDACSEAVRWKRNADGVLWPLDASDESSYRDAWMKRRDSLDLLRSNVRNSLTESQVEALGN